LGANLKSAELIGTTLRNAELSEADLSYSQLSQAVFDGTRLVKTSFMGSSVVNTLFARVDLSEAKDLETVNHLGPSSIGIDTIYESQGKIPDVFLRGAGVPEPFITNMRALVAAMEPIQFYSCFISYSSEDREFAERLHADLQSKNVRCWFDREDMKIGDRIRPRIDEAIRAHDKLLLVLTENSMKSPWVEKEVETAFEKERKQGRTMLFPIRLDDEVIEAEEAWAADIRRTRHIGDFRAWKNHDDYKKAFERLMRDLKA
jgi:TIR domain/Pentapeptide repeats (8 copies)